eukprot:1071046-Karenia_brevis.AAC.1
MDKVCSQACKHDWADLPIAGREASPEAQGSQEGPSMVTLTPEPTPTEAAKSPYLVPSNTEPEPEDIKVEKQEAKDESMKEEMKDESGGALEPSAPLREAMTMKTST